MCWEAGAAGVSARWPGPPASLQKQERPLKGDHSRQLTHGAHYTSRTFCRLRMTSQMELMQSGGGDRSQLKTLSFVNYPPNPLGL